ncbi:GPI ethanolamine phosphate transferase 3-like [Neltuma alba]|uniref:GPI ethanolamine phosphate transferase 3-like n=1 Tax=Neltuma alba TaxID=207710 RepID=UPI0010A30DDF|nr:GPI ethanolamine phosphate transferase 3-like [Prosopis alba]
MARKMEPRRRSPSGKWEYIWPMWLTLLLHVVAIFLFTRGFLLTRTELPYYSSCSDISQSPCFSSSDNLNSTTNSSDGSCWTKPAINRLVIIVLDALRFDFVAPSSFFPESKPWMDKLQVLRMVASRNGSSARIFKAFADPPTTSLQRLKGLTTGGLPTFVDVGNSFGAPAIVEDNLIHQLVQNGKKVLMMGDDTWTQLFPHHFERSYPYPSFNVKDLDTVDNGCIDHLIPSLHEENWDVLISHFLGVDHAGHIFGVDSNPMIEKLQQYNNILERVIEELESQSGPGGLHENTMLIVMGDHGQTLNGDHGGGGSEEVETAVFAMNFKKPPSSIPPEFDSSACRLDMDGNNVCISSMQQLDFAATVSALIGIPFPYGSIGRINPELYALGARRWDLGAPQEPSESDVWMQNYANVLCVNSWQVKRYIDVYSASSAVGFSSDDLSRIASTYAQAESHWLHSTKKLLSGSKNGSDTILPTLQKQIDAYFNFLATVAELARLKWTEFDLKLMISGILIMLLSIIFQILSILRGNKQLGIFMPLSGASGIFSISTLAYVLLAIRACSFLSNSYILEEGKVANFLLATSGIVMLRYAVRKEKLLPESFGFLLLCAFCQFSIEVGLTKQAATSAFMKEHTSWILNITSGFPVWEFVAEVAPMLALILLAFLLYKATNNSSFKWAWKYTIRSTILSYMLILLHWISDGNRIGFALMPESIGRNYVPRIIYAISLGQLLLLSFGALFEDNSLDCKKNLITKTVAILSAWSSTVILLSGKQGPMIACASTIGGYCILRMDNTGERTTERPSSSSAVDPFRVMQWSLFAVCLFFCSGHWCAFDGLRYGAAFVGFEEFVLIRQAILLTIDTFGFSIILPVLGLPFLVATMKQANQTKHFIYTQLSQAYVMYGLSTAITTTFAILCVTVQRRHLMVWGLFAPKFVFDVIGLLLTDIFTCWASLYYFDQVKDDQ